ncbi:T6SS effector amidase Tae4 family protein [Bowmanella denitrificans]|uniref:T6SS effector amidase Tae4 family protein n=1 Tax=Bowmanella denitrificans TaxID=366582 RepID=UPI000C9A510E|nr:T6SS effector amidase Tae4 family protein [Bowmanella denitrificans]
MSALSFQTLWDNHPWPHSPCDTTAFTNQCAIRMGVALELSNVDTSGFDQMFPQRRCYPGFGHSPKHILAAQQLADWMNSDIPKFGACVKLKQVTSGDFGGKKGIVFIKNGWGTTDHIDLWNGTEMKAGSPDYFSRGQEVWFWEIKR